MVLQTLGTTDVRGRWQSAEPEDPTGHAYPVLLYRIKLKIYPLYMLFSMTYSINSFYLGESTQTVHAPHGTCFAF